MRGTSSRGLISSRPRLAFLASHPIQYQAPLFRALEASGRVDLEVLFLSEFGVEPTFDPGFGRVIRFDVPLTEGFAHRFVPKVGSPGRIGPPFGLVNPSLVHQLHRGHYDAVAVQGYVQVSNWIAFASAAVTGVRLLLRGDTPEPSAEHEASWRWRLKRRALAPVINRADALLAVGKSNAEFWRRMGARPDQLVWAPYSVDNRRFSEGGAKGRRARRETLGLLDLDPDLPVVLFAAKLSPHKRVLDLVAAMDQLDQTASLVVIGDGEQRQEVAHLAAQRPWMRTLGFVNQGDLPAWYGTSDIVVLPSDHEPWGLVINEAMAAGAVPIVSDAVGCGPDLVADGAGRIFPVGNVTALASALADLVDLPTLRAARAESRGRIARYGLDATVRGIETAALRPR